MQKLRRTSPLSTFMKSIDEQLQSIKQDVLDLTTSPLYAERIRNKVFPVIGEGSHTADIMFVGEAPGRNEAATGRPFAGAAGKVLDKLLESVQIKRAEVYVTNIVKDRPTNNRDPLPEEIALYAPFLDKQIHIIQPKIIVTLGRFSMQYIMNKFKVSAQLQSISKIHGQLFPAKTSYGDITILPLYHPAAALYNPNLLESLQHDIQALKKLS